MCHVATLVYHECDRGSSPARAGYVFVGVDLFREIGQTPRGLPERGGVRG